jgi:hypothetical protein
MDNMRHRRFQFSVRSLMIASAVVALLLVPLAWVARERQHMLQLQNQILMAREVALASVVREEKLRRDEAAAATVSAASAEELKRENAELRQQVETLRREVGLLKQHASVAGSSGR